MNLERLERAADLLDKVPEDYLDMEIWADSAVHREFDGTFECGFAGCAIGWIGHAGLFKDEGFRLVGGVPYMDSPERNLFNWEAVHALFDIDGKVSTHLFTEGSYESANPRKVADRIRRTVLVHRQFGGQPT